jgi:hypothetical protein
VLIISLTVIQISIAFIKSIKKQVNKRMLKALDLGYKDSKKGFINNRKDFTSLANKFTSLTDCAKLTNVQKRYMSNTMLLTSNS